MSSQRYSNKEHEYVKVRSIDLDAPQLKDQIDRELLDHLIACRTCTTIFAAQKNSIGGAGCVVGRRIVSQSEVRRQEHRFTLAVGHVTEETLDEYLFDRLTADEIELLDYHARFCSQCANRILERQRLISCMKAVFRERLNAVKSPSPQTGGCTISRRRHQCVCNKYAAQKSVAGFTLLREPEEQSAASNCAFPAGHPGAHQCFPANQSTQGVLRLRTNQ
jgi:hypothetical protein